MLSGMFPTSFNISPMIGSKWGEESVAMNYAFVEDFIKGY